MYKGLYNKLVGRIYPLAIFLRAAHSLKKRKAHDEKARTLYRPLAAYKQLAAAAPAVQDGKKKQKKHVLLHMEGVPRLLLMDGH